MEKYKKTALNDKFEWNDKFELADASYFVTDIQDYIEFIIKKHETLRTILPIHVYIKN